MENLFYNMIARRKTLQNSSDDYTKIVDLLSRMAIHHTNVSFSCRKVGYANERNSFLIYFSYILLVSRYCKVLFIYLFIVNVLSTELLEQMFTLFLHRQGLILSELYMECRLLVI